MTLLMRFMFLGLCVLIPGLAAADFDRAAWDGLLKRHVRLIDGGVASQVDYSGFQSDRLSKVSGGRAESWLVQEAQYDLAHVRTDRMKLKRLELA